jgi:hypothetical protein
MAEETKPNLPRRQSPSFIRFLYNAAILIAFLSLIATMGYLFFYLFQSPPPDQLQGILPSYNAERKMTLISTAFFVAMSFGFMGFALFLIDAKGEIEGEAALPGSANVKIAKMSPGIFALLCATIIIVISVNTRVDYTYENVTTTESKADSTTKDSGQKTEEERKKEELADTTANLHPIKMVKAGDDSKKTLKYLIQ